MTDADQTAAPIPDQQPRTTTYVLLTDANDATVLVRCPDEASAKTIGDAAIFSDGDVSAWLVPAYAVTDLDTVTRILRDGGRCDDIHDAHLPIRERDVS